MSEPETLSYESSPATLNGVGIGTIALQLVGVYCMVFGLPMLSMLAAYIGTSGVMSTRGGGWWQILFSFAAPGVYIVMGVLLIRFAGRLSRWLFRGDVARMMAGAVTAPAGQYLQAVAFSVAGVMTMINAAPRLVSLLWMFLMDMGSRFEGYVIVVEPIAQFLLGLALFLQSKGLSLLWHKIRAGGVLQPASVHSDADKA
ncbi:MAG: hypothetical protein QOF78_683 [Phycisphaerales bacterium]|jgi:hypothetical protein|nr:hypothetical protein [Phycisphaerales bacterium]